LSTDPTDASIPEALQTLLPADTEPGDTIGLDDEDVQRNVGPIHDVTPMASNLELGRVLGKGGMAVVREAEQRVLKRPVAVKSAREGQEHSANRLVLEARITGALEHPGIPPVHDIVGDDTGVPHIVMQRVEGRPWSDWMDDAEALEEAFGVTDVLGWNLGVLESICNTVHYAHAQGVVHRDLKPDNIMIGRFGQVYVLDWGIAVSIRPDDPRFPNASDQRRIVGTPRYMAPEMVTGDGRLVGAHTDVYLLGALLYRILEGRPPHRGFSVREILSGIPSFEPTFDASVPVSLAALVRDAMHVDPTQRVESAEVFRRRLQAFQEHRSSSRLAAQAIDRLTDLEALLATESPDRVRVYDLFGAIRFGCREALDAWPDNPVAQEGLERAVLRLADWELEQGDDRSAEVLLGVLEDVPDGMLSRLETVREARLTNLERLERLRARRDARVGQRSRLYIVGGLTALWTITPFLSRNATGPGASALAALWLTLVVAAVWSQKRVWSATVLNRRVALLLFGAILTQVILMAGVPLGILTREAGLAVLSLTNAAFSGVAASIVNVRFVLPMVVFIAVYLLHGFVDEGHVLRSVGNFTVGATALWVWWPKPSKS
jgi:serine/threonine-protein kinase